ncbi:MAG: ABC transporter permease subunit [Mycoplasmatales bacterium]|nr:ABC transporter permease subunit [Mycoplasmatales bacterium]
MEIHWKEIWEQLLVHIEYSFLATLVSIIIGILLGILIHKTKFAKLLVTSSFSILQVIPSIAIFGLLIPFIDDILIIVLITLIAYGIFPILSNTIVALNNTKQESIDTAISLGLNRFQILFRIKIMSHIGTIINGIRITSTLLIGGASIAFTISGGGLGQIINEGIQTRNSGLVLQGMVPVVLLAFLSIGILTLFKYSFTERGVK